MEIEKQGGQNDQEMYCPISDGAHMIIISTKEGIIMQSFGSGITCTRHRICKDKLKKHKVISCFC